MAGTQREQDRLTLCSARAGFTLIELMMVCAIIGTLSAIAIPHLKDSVKGAKVSRAAQEIRVLEVDIASYEAGFNKLPPDLASIGRGGMLDPWGNPYEYTNLQTVKGKGKARKDKFLVPLNSDYDLWSDGEDGASVGPLTAKASRDDIVRANDGSFVGLASKY